MSASKHMAVANLRGILLSKPRVNNVKGQRVANASIDCGRDRIGLSAWETRRESDRPDRFAALGAGVAVQVSGNLSEQLRKDEDGSERAYWSVRVFRWSTGSSGGRALFFAVADFRELSYDENGRPWARIEVRPDTDDPDKVQRYTEQLAVNLLPKVEELFATGSVAPGQLVRIKGAIYQRPMEDDYGIVTGNKHGLVAHTLETWDEGQSDWAALAKEAGV